MDVKWILARHIHLNHDLETKHMTYQLIINHPPTSTLQSFLDKPDFSPRPKQNCNYSWQASIKTKLHARTESTAGILLSLRRFVVRVTRKWVRTCLQRWLCQQQCSRLMTKYQWLITKDAGNPKTTYVISNLTSFLCSEIWRAGSGWTSFRLFIMDGEDKLKASTPSTHCKKNPTPPPPPTLTTHRRRLSTWPKRDNDGSRLRMMMMMMGNGSLGLMLRSGGFRSCQQSSGGEGVFLSHIHHHQESWGYGIDQYGVGN